MEAKDQKTLIVSVLFLDIVGYSKRSVSDQVAIKQAFNSHLAMALQPVAADGRIVLDTGDGAAVAFLHHPEDALLASDRLLELSATTQGDYELRSGIHFGPAVVVHDVNGFGNLVGDAINDAQRVMSFADNGKVFASRAYADMVSRISADFAKRFSPAWTLKDKHGKPHEVARVAPPSGTVAHAAVPPAIPPAKAGRVGALKPLHAALVGFLLLSAIAGGWFAGDGKPRDPVPAAAAPAPPAVPSPPVAPQRAEPPNLPSQSTQSADVSRVAPPQTARRESRSAASMSTLRQDLPIVIPAERDAPCPQCNCPDLLTKTSLGVQLTPIETRHLTERCR